MATTLLLLHWTKKTFWVSMRIRPSDSVPQCSTTEPQNLHGEQGPLWSSYITCILHTTRISNVNSIMFVNRIREMVSFKLSKEIKKDILHLVIIVGQRTSIHLSYSIYKHNTIDITDPYSMQDVCHMNFLIGLAHHRVSLAQ